MSRQAVATATQPRARDGQRPVRRVRRDSAGGIREQDAQAAAGPTVERGQRVCRAVVLEICQALNVPSNKRVIKPESLRKAEGIFLTLSSHGIVLVSSLDGELVQESPLVDQVRRAYWDAVAKN